MYAPRFDTVELIEKGKDNLLSCRVYAANTLVAPTSGTVTITNGSGVVVISAAAVTVSAATATYTLLAASTSSLQFEENWLISWSLVMPDTKTYQFENQAHLVRVALKSVVSDQTLLAIVPGLDSSSTGSYSNRKTYQTIIDQAWFTIVNRSINSGLKPWMALNASVFRECHIQLSLALIFEDLSTSQNELFEKAQSYRASYELEWGRVQAIIDLNQDKVPDVKQVARRPVWLM